MNYAVGNDLDSEALGVADRLVTGLSVAHHARQFDSFGDPTPVVLAIEFNRELHTFMILLERGGARRTDDPRSTAQRLPGRGSRFEGRPATSREGGPRFSGVEFGGGAGLASSGCANVPLTRGFL